MTLTELTREAERINRSARQIFQEIESTNTGIRLLGVTMTNFVDHTELPLVEEKKTTSLFTSRIFDVKKRLQSLLQSVRS